ncbi:MAG: hypothetical protein AAF432_04255, partial [Planctomycetota bacterium]
MASRTTLIGTLVATVGVLAYTALAVPGGGDSGACCLPSGACEFVDGDAIPQVLGGGALEYCEFTLGGTYLGDGTDCNQNPCNTQACCMMDNSCEELNAADCDAAGGELQGSGTFCETIPSLAGDFPVNCQVQLQACCFSAGECDDLTFGDCLSMGGSPVGIGSFCEVTTDPGDGSALSEGFICPLDNCPGTEPCFQQHDSVGCDDEACCNLVCAEDSFCCEVSWDSLCVDEANVLCATGGACCFSNGICEIAPTALDCIESGGEFSAGLFCDEADCEPMNDDCVNATLIQEIPACVTGSIDNASPDPEAWICPGDDVLPENEAAGPGIGPSVGVWYTVVGTGNEMVASLCRGACEGVVGEMEMLGTGSGEPGGHGGPGGPMIPVSIIDYEISVFCGTCDNLECVTFDDDTCAMHLEDGAVALGGPTTDPCEELLGGPGDPGDPGDVNPIPLFPRPEATWCSEAGVTYYILVTGRRVNVAEMCEDIENVAAGPIGMQVGAPGIFELYVDDIGEPCPSESACGGIGADFCEDAEFICPEIVYEDDTFDATSDFLENGGDFQLDVIHCGLYFGMFDEWYAYRAAWDGMVTLIVEGVDNPTFKWTFGVYPDCKTDETEQIACNELVHTAAFFEAERGEVYYFRVARNNFERGRYRLSFLGPDCAPDAGDLNNNGTPDMQECIEDVDGNGVVEYADFIDVILGFQECLDPNGCDFDEDVDGNGDVDPADAMIVFEAIGRVCPADPFSLSDYIDGR